MRYAWILKQLSGEFHADSLKIICEGCVNQLDKVKYASSSVTHHPIHLPRPHFSGCSIHGRRAAADGLPTKNLAPCASRHLRHALFK